MSLPTNLPSRRKFLERSMLGFGSAFVLPSLLASCTDHRITPGPITTTPGPDTPTVGADPIDFNDTAKSVIETELGLVPKAGGLLSGLINIFWLSWNTEQPVWNEINFRSGYLINQKISDPVFQQLITNDLDGLNKSTTFYMHAVRRDSPPDEVKKQWLSARDSFAKALPDFQAKGYETLLLPMFAQLANMYLAILRDGVIKGQDWGRSSGEQQQDIADLKNAIDTFSTYATKTYQDYVASLSSSKKNDPSLIEPFNSVNSYTRSTTLWVLDFVTMWPYYDVNKYPQGAKVTPSREIYSDPYGGLLRGTRLALPQKPPTSFPIEVTVKATTDYIYGVQLTYPDNSGPDGVTKTAWMGTEKIPDSPPSRGGYFFTPSTGPIVKFRVAGWVNSVFSLTFQLGNGTTSGVMGGQGVDKGTDSGWQGFYGEALSSIYIHGVGDRGTADCIVFGFMPWPSPAKTQNALRHLYITSPTEQSAADFAQAFPTQGITSALITEELKAARQAYWDSIAARAK